ncbi:MAG: hypothetical protein GXO34_06280 [Deltaproteobacteria bacterium]|nr:hypothetical protein [Deltaproteobacteria bacterium]
MLNLASLCFPDREKSCFFCCPPIRDPEADPLDDIATRRAALRRNRRELEQNLASPREIPGDSCWGLGFLDDQEKQAGCLLHPLQNHGRDLRHLTGYQFKCANALCREAQVFSGLQENEKEFCLNLCRGMNSFTYSSRSNPLMQLLAWEEKMVGLIAGKHPAGLNRNDFTNAYGFLWRDLDFRLDGYLAVEIATRRDPDFLRERLTLYSGFRQNIIAKLKDLGADLAASSDSQCPSHCLAIPLSLSRLLKFGAGLWKLPLDSDTTILSLVNSEIDQFLKYT